jgi:hypothetical protein
MNRKEDKVNTDKLSKNSRRKENINKKETKEGEKYQNKARNGERPKD